MSKRKIILIIAISLVFLLLALRGPMVRLLVSQKAKSLEENHSLLLDYDKLKITGLATVKIDKLSICQKERDTLFLASHMRLRLNPFKLLTLSPDLKQLDADNIELRFIKGDSLSNFDFLFEVRKQNTAATDTLAKDPSPKKSNYARTAERLFKLFSDVLPSNANINNIKIRYVNNKYSLDIYTPSFLIDKGCFSTIIQTNENGVTGAFKMEGALNNPQPGITARLFSDDGQKLPIPFIDFRWGAKAEFDTLAFAITEPVKKSDHITFTGKTLASGITLNHRRLSPENVSLEKGVLNYSINIGRDYLELDSCSEVRVNNMTFSPYFRAQKKEKWRFTASVNKDSFRAEELFSSLPKGLFYNLEGIRTSGNLSYHFYLDLDLTNVDSLKLESSLIPDNFTIEDFGNTDFRKINGDFEYTAYEKGVAVRSFNVGPSNNNFRTLDKISPYLQMTVLQSEDGGFFYHKGFLPESMREALAQDIRERRFYRGGSTISMQLVKNVFLSRNKTLARKFEEIMIVWLIERGHLSTKERMFEVYLNIIEWGPGVYGICEASHFYFDKEPKDINVNEAIFLSEIIPAPKWALNSFDDDLQLKPSHEGYYRLLAQRLRIKGMLTEAEEANVRPEVRLRGEAKYIIRSRAHNK